MNNYYTNKYNKIAVTYLHRKPVKGFSFSIESIFIHLRNQLTDKIDYSVVTCRFFNSGFLSIIFNCIHILFRKKKGIRHITGEVHFLNLLLNRKKTILTIHDCGMYYRKKGISKWLVKLIYLSWPIKKAQIITTVSFETKNQIIEITNNTNADIRVIYNPLNEIFISSPKLFNAGKPEILQIGVAENKNVNRLIQSLEGISCRLVLIGTLNDQLLELLDLYKIDYSNYFNLSPEDILLRYQSCDVVSFVSTYEGFGMPIIEAQAVERLVITSNCSSMPEIAGNGACFVDPYNVSSIRQGFINLIGDDNYRYSLIEYGKLNVTRFQSKKIANDYLDIYKEFNIDFSK